MSINYGNLERKVQQHDGAEKVGYVGMLNVPGVITGSIVISDKEKIAGKEWPLYVKIHSGGAWATLGSATWERKNASASWYLRVVLESPVIQNKLGSALWLRAFPQGEDAGSKPKATEYDLVWGSGGGGKLMPQTPDLGGDGIPSF